MNENGLRKLEWARTHMKVLRSIAEEMKESQSLKGIRIGMALHVEAKTGILALTLQEAGAEVRLASCNPLSTDNDVSEALNDLGLPTFARKGESNEEYYQNLDSVLAHNPQFLIDDGGDLIKMVHERGMDIMGASEETTTGIVRLRAMEKDGVLKFPVMSANDALMKHLFDNRYGTGQSTFDGILTATNLVIAGKTFVVGGYGWCGRGIAMRAKGLGAEVVVTEIDPVKAVEARLDGFQVMPMRQAAKIADFICTVTGNCDLVTTEDFKVMKDGCVLSNSGHFNNEINIPDLEAMAVEKKEVRKMVDAYTLEDGRTFYLLADGRLINLSAGQGHPVEIMDMSFAIQALGVEYVVRNHATMEHKVHKVPDEIDERVAWAELKALGIEIDTLTAKQREYMASWSHGT
jgi:adenosylhomocysteinase